MTTAISAHKMRIIVYMIKNKDVITFKEQNVYKHSASFKRAMRELNEKKVVLIRQLRTGNQYKLSNMGRTLGLILDEFVG